MTKKSWPCSEFTKPTPEMKIEDWNHLCLKCGFSYGQHWIFAQPEFRKNPHAVALGRKGGKVKSDAKKASGKANLAKARAAKLAKKHGST
jgi:hypothetical protein